jgi:hypothetical protein
MSAQTIVNQAQLQSRQEVHEFFGARRRPSLLSTPYARPLKMGEFVKTPLKSAECRGIHFRQF